MHSESGVSLVSGALQSSLARAQRNYHYFNGLEKEDKNQKKAKGVNSHLVSYCNIIGSKFASYSSDQFLELGNSLRFDDGGFLQTSIPNQVKKDCAILQQNEGFAVSQKKRKLVVDKCGCIINLQPSPAPSRLQNGPLSSPQKNISRDNTTRTPKENQPHTTVVDQSQRNADNLINRLKKILQDKSIGKSKKRRIVKRLRFLQQQKGEVESVNITNKSTAANQSSSSPGNTLVPLSPTCPGNINAKKSPVKKGTSTMGPEADKAGLGLTNGSMLSSTSTSTVNTNTNLHLPNPKRILYPKENIVLGWRVRRGPGAGFHNFGNTCYLNSSLQALFHIPAFVNWILNDEEHRKMCNGILPNSTPCIICVVYVTLQEHSRSNNCPIRPRVLDKLKAICKHFNYGRQEDAHEFLRYLLEGMERSYLTLINGLRLDNRTKETNPLGQIFGGYIRTEVTCLHCNFTSTTFQPSAELHLDIRFSTTLEDAIQNHFRKERLDNNDYRCEKCKKISQATKQFSLELPPLVLCLQLKRFTLYGTKISKRIHCNRYLNMSRYLHKSRKTSGFYQENELKYRLVALVTHLGQSPNCGHYTAIAEVPGGSYYQFDDQFVHEVSVQTALNNDAYVIIYEMDRGSHPMNTERPTPAIKSSSIVPAATLTNSNGTNSNGTNAGSMKKFAVPFAKTNETSSSSSIYKPSVISNAVARPKLNGTTSLATIGDRPPIRFGISTSPLKSFSTAPNKINILQPGVATTNSSKLYTTPPLTAKSVVPCVVNATSKKLKLVPYNDVDEDDDDDDDDSNPDECKSLASKSPEPAEVLSRKKIIGPQLPGRKSKSPTPNFRDPGHDTTDATSPEEKYGVKRKLEEILGPLPQSSQSKLPKNVVRTEKLKSKSGYSSDTETCSKKRKPEGFSRAKSVEHTVPTRKDPAALIINGPLIPNSKKTSLPKRKDTPGEIVNKVLCNGKDVQRASLQGHKRKRMSSSSTSSSSSSSGQRKHKSKKKKMRTSSPSSSSDSDSSSHHHRKSRKLCKKDKDRNLSKDKDKGTHNKSKKSTSVEREESLRKARNPSPSISAVVKCNPAELRRPEIVGWAGQGSALSTSIHQEKTLQEEKSKNDFDDELDKGRTKKQRLSHSPSGEQVVNKFQKVQDNKTATDQWSKLLDGYGDGFKYHSKEKSREQRPGINKDTGRSHQKFRRDGERYPQSSHYKNRDREHYRRDYNRHNRHRDFHNRNNRGDRNLWR